MNDELYEGEGFAYEDEGYEFEDAFEDEEYSNEFEYGVQELNELEVSDLAMELLGVASEAELDQFLGALAKRVVRGAKAFAKSSVGKAIGGALKSVAKTALPMAGAALGNLVAPGLGGAIGGKLGSMASKLLEAEEAEMLGEEEAELEAARRYVRWAAGTIRNAARAPRGVAPQRVARSAAVASARRYAPALLNDRRVSPWRGRRGPGWGTPTWSVQPWYPAEPVGQPCTCGHGAPVWGAQDQDQNEFEAQVAGPRRQSGTWVRRGRNLVLIGGAL